jgi:lysophospholipase L1-like esterase
MPRDSNRLCLKFFLATLPFSVIFTFALVMLFVSGELLSVDRVIQMQKENATPVLFGFGYSDPDLYYKMKSVLIRNPEVLVLGTSRVLQIRSGFFLNSRFYNAGRAIAKVGHLRHFLAQIPKEKEPRVILLGLDQNFFNAAWDRSVGLYDIEQRYICVDSRFRIIGENWFRIFKDYKKRKFSIRNILKKDAHVKRIGLNAIINDLGYRNDGSQRNDKFIEGAEDPKNPDYQFRETFDHISKGINRFEFGDEPAVDVLRELDRFLSECKIRNIYVVGFLNPYPHAVWEKLKSTKKHRYLFQLAATLKPLFANQGYSFSDFSDLADLGAADQENLDGFHASEKAYLRLLIQILEKDSVLRRHADLGGLKDFLASSVNPHNVFPD